MDRDEVEELNADLAEFTSDVFAYLPYRGQRAHGMQYLRGLMLDGKRKSVEPMAKRLGAPRQNLGHFVAQSPWDYREVLRRVADRTIRVVRPTAWVIDDHPFRPLRASHRRSDRAALRRTRPAPVPGGRLRARDVAARIVTAALAAVPAQKLGR